MDKTLQMIFINQEGRRQTISLANPREDLTGPEVGAVMAQLIDRDIFAGTGGGLTSAVEGRVVGRTVDVLYDGS